MSNKPPALDARLTTTLAEINEFIDARAADVKSRTPGVPVEVIRNLLTHGLCPCGAYRDIRAKDDAEVAQASA